MGTWDSACIDSLSGKTIVMTGGSGGAGPLALEALIENDASVIVGMSDGRKGADLLERIRARHPSAKLTLESLDLGSHSSISSFADRILQGHPTVDVLINNASPRGSRERKESRDGHERVFSVNYLGHFILTHELFPLLLRGYDPRVICVSDLAHREGHFHFKDLDLHEGYSARRAFAQAKLGLLSFALELNRRCVAHGIHLKSIPVHLGPGLLTRPALGALPLLFAATSLEARGGTYYGPGGMGEMWGSPMEAEVAVQAENFVTSQRLWEESERLSGKRFDVVSSKTIGLH